MESGWEWWVHDAITAQAQLACGDVRYRLACCAEVLHELLCDEHGEILLLPS